MLLSAGTRLGPYEIVAPIGAGGMGEVYRARDARLGRDVALKLLPAEFSADPARLARFEHEARAAGSLDHPGIVAVHDIGVHDGLHYIVSELVDGRTFRALLVEGPLPLRKAADLAAQIAATVAAAHAAGIVHRDLKPENIMVTRDGRAKVLDFGLARHVVSADQSTTVTALTNPGMVVGTVGYMSPEQVRGESVGHPSDIFSFGLILYEMLCGRRAFQRDTAAETMTAILRDDPPELPGTITAGLRSIVEHCLEREAAGRFQSAKDLAFALRSFSSTTTSSGPVPPLQRAAPGRRRLLAAIAILLCGLLLGYVPARWLEPDLIDQSKLRFTPLVIDPGLETTPRWSPRGDAVAYAADVNGVFQIFTRKPGSTDSTQHTRHGFDCLTPFWSPDGTRLYYTVLDVTDRTEIWTVAIAGGEPERLLEQAAYGALSSDGRTLAFLRCALGEGACSVWLSSPPGAQPSRFPKPPFDKRESMSYNTWLDFAPTGGPLGILDTSTNTVEFYRASQDGGACRREWTAPMRPATTARSFSWLPDGEGILRAEWESVYVSSLNLVRGNRSMPLHRSESIVEKPTVSPDGNAVCYQLAHAGYDVQQVRLDGSGMQPVITTDADERSPSWSPDGRLIAFVKSGAVHIYDLQSATNRRLLSSAEAALDFDMAFSPNGKRLAFRRQKYPEVAIYITTPTGDTPVPLWKDPELSPQRGPTWSPDGNWIAYYGLKDGKPAIFKARVGGNEEPQFVTSETAARPPRWSPRGDWIACDTARGVNLVSPDGKQRRKLSGRTWETLGFSADGQRLIGIFVSDRRRLLLASVDISSGDEKTLGDLGPRPASFTAARLRAEFPLRGFSLAPDGKSFLTSMVRESSDLWILEGINQRRTLWQRLWPSHSTN